MDVNDEYVQYFIVNKELNMSSGKIASQVAHVAVDIALDHWNKDYFRDWYLADQKKIILQGSEKQLQKLIKKGAYFIKDNGLTEIEKGSLTCVGFPPMKKHIAQQKYVKRLQLLKG